MKAVISLYDNKSETYLEPRHFTNLDFAKATLRQFVEQETKDPNSKFRAIDFDLFHLGDYDENTAKFELFEKPKHLFNCRILENLKQPAANQEIKSESQLKSEKISEESIKNLETKATA